MILLKDKSKCCGCSACAQRCPKGCIRMKEDDEGFLYPEVDASKCINCGLCERVCPLMNKNEVVAPKSVYAASSSNDDVLMTSSSGGVFTCLADKCIDEGGVVFGVLFNEKWEPTLSFAESKEACKAFRGSKYVQAIVGDAYRQAEIFLKQGRNVLFSGTPCQIAALRQFLRKNYDNLVTVDIVCHGVPSPGVWRQYLSEFLEFNVPSDAVLTGVNFRDKLNGWKDFGISFSYVTGDKQCTFYQKAFENAYMRLFLTDVILRPSCYVCNFKNGTSGSDITLGDFWGVEKTYPDLYSKRGVSAIVVNSVRGEQYLKSLDMHLCHVEYNDVMQFNSAYIRSSTPHLKRESFFCERRRKFIHYLSEKYTKRSVFSRIMRRIIHGIKLSKIV